MDTTSVTQNQEELTTVTQSADASSSEQTISSDCVGEGGEAEVEERLLGARRRG